MSKSDRESESAPPRKGWILYDGECGFCLRWVHLWKRAVERHGFALKDLQSASADGSLEISPENLLHDIRVLTRNGKLESGANAYLYVPKSGVTLTLFPQKWPKIDVLLHEFCSSQPIFKRCSFIPPVVLTYKFDVGFSLSTYEWGLNFLTREWVGFVAG
jgi:hypothetical protein